MSGIELDSMTLYLLMAVGAAFAGFAAFLLLRPAPPGGAKVELFGMKFEAASSALLIFLIGAALLTLPLWTTRVDPDGARGGARTAGTSGAAAGTATGAATTNAVVQGGQAALVLPAVADTSEVEPNDAIQNASQIAPGTTVRGTVRNEDMDWYVIALTPSENQMLRVFLRHTGGEHVKMTVYDADERRIKEAHTDSGSVIIEHELGAEDRAFVRVENYFANYTTTYELFYRIESIAP